ncbi:hypothetical protein SLS53_003641 [Cytospora paraplurivora]|uniref:O-methyltransferase C-terminal domain-containing protein n=1 Tax=Cytospora paraplurivora TaxID=2898453 RepID=A0AAN9U9S7_9PEZI
MHLHALHRFKVPSFIPEVGSIPLPELTAHIPTVSPDVLSRLLNHAVGNYILIRPEPGHIAHSAVSAMLAASPEMQDWLGSACEDIWPAASQVVPALVKWPRSVEPHQTGLNLMGRTEEPFFTILSHDPDREKRFASAMSIMKGVPGFQPSAALEAYDWGALGEAVVVDVGGSKGDFALALTEMYPKLSVIVQDVPVVVDEGRSMLPERVGPAITFQGHNFFETQPVQGADVYFFRMILHDWPDEYCLRILRNLVPALKPGARVIINDRCVPPTEEMSHYEARQTRSQDIAMMAVFNSKERSEVEWRSLISRADSRFHFESIVQLKPSPLAVMELSWRPLGST